MMFTRNVWLTRLLCPFQRSTQLLTVGCGLCGAVPCCVVLVVVVLVGAAAVVDVPVPTPAWVVVEPVVPTVALVLLSSPRKISSAARNPTAIASTAMIQVLAPLRSIAAAR